MVRLIKGNKEMICSVEEAEEHIQLGGWERAPDMVKKEKLQPTSSAPPMLKAFVNSMRKGGS